MNKELKPLLTGDLKVVNTEEGLRYYSTNNEDYRTMKKFLNLKGGSTTLFN